MADIGYSIFLEPTDTVRAFRARDQLQPGVAAELLALLRKKSAEAASVADEIERALG